MILPVGISDRNGDKLWLVDREIRRRDGEEDVAAIRRSSEGRCERRRAGDEAKTNYRDKDTTNGTERIPGIHKTTLDDDWLGKSYSLKNAVTTMAMNGRTWI
jgi:hypothetical protein